MTPTTRLLTVALAFASLFILSLGNAHAMGRSGAPSAPLPGCCKTSPSEQSKLQAQLDALRKEMATLKAQVAASGAR